MRHVQDFSGNAYLLNDPDTVFAAQVKVDLNRITINTDGTEIGSWRHDEVTITDVKDHIHLTADGETLVIDMDGRDFFLDLLGIAPSEQTRSRRRRRENKEWEAERQPATFSIANLKERALADSADPLDRRLAILMGGAAIVMLVGAALTWGPYRLLDPGSFPISRLLAGFGGLGGLLALYLAYFDRSRFTGSAAAVAAGVVSFAIVYLYARSARLGVGCVLVLIGSQLLTVVGVIGIFGRRTPSSE